MGEEFQKFTDSLAEREPGFLQLNLNNLLSYCAVMESARSILEAFLPGDRGTVVPSACTTQIPGLALMPKPPLEPSPDILPGGGVPQGGRPKCLHSLSQVQFEKLFRLFQAVGCSSISGHHSSIQRHVSGQRCPARSEDSEAFSETWYCTEEAKNPRGQPPCET